MNRGFHKHRRLLGLIISDICFKVNINILKSITNQKDTFFKPNKSIFENKKFFKQLSINNIR